MAGQQYQDANKENWSFQEFGSVNTQAARQNIKDDEFAWIEGAQPVGFGNIKTLAKQSTSLATTPGSTYYMLSLNIAGVDYMLMFCADGSAYQVNLLTNARTTIGTAATFSASGVQCCQWKNERALIIDPTKGYFSWDGATLTTINGVIQTINVTYTGTGYTARPNVTVGGPGSGASFQAVMGVVAAVVAAAGTGYFVGDILTVSGGTNTRPAKISVTAVGTSNAITGFTVLDSGDYTAVPANPVSVTGGLGSGATFTATFGVASVTVLGGGTGFTSTPAVTFSAGNATATASVSVAPSAGNCIASYGGRVWVSAGRTVVFSAPNSYTDFSTANAGGSFIFTDETLHSNINQIISANNFLYIAGDSSFNVISDVRVSAGITIFSNTNVSASVGANFYASIVPYYRSLWFANRYGIYALYGSTTQKASDALDGVFPRINLGSGISGGQFVINSILCLGFLCNYQDPVAGARPLLLIYAGKKWFFASQGSSLTFIAGAEVNGVPLLYGTDGGNLYQLFSDTTSPVSVTIKSKLWDLGDPLRVKQVFKGGLEANVAGTTAGTVSFSVDTEYGSINSFSNLGLTVTWINNAGAVIAWQNGSAATIPWLAGVAGYSFTKFDTSAFGNYVGVTLTATTPQAVYSAFHLQYEKRAIWATPGS
jgi:hypothetical protein